MIKVLQGVQRRFAAASTNSIQTSVIFLLGVSCLLPLITIYPVADFENSVIKLSLMSQRNKNSSIVAASLAIPVFLDLALETLISILTIDKSDKIKMHVRQALLNSPERFLLACAILTVPISTFLPSNTAHLVNIYLCLYKSRLIFMGGAAFSSLCRYDPKFWPVWLTNFGIALLGAACFGGAYADNTMDGNSISPIIHVLALTLFAIGSMMFFYCNFKWLISVIPRLCQALWMAPSRENPSNTSPDVRDSLFHVLYVTTVTGASIVLSVTRKLYPENSKLNSDTLFAHNLLFNLYLLFVMYISERMVKYEVVKGLYALIESKKMYVRYISHELRTPLNSAFLGLKLLSDELKMSEQGKDFDHQETLLDVQSACRIAVEILNDLLCFDKLESGILELHKHEVPAISFVTDCVNMFAAQAREGGVSISCAVGRGVGVGAGGGGREGGDGYAGNANQCLQDQYPISKPEIPFNASHLLESDVVSMDKFKMDQVLRNLISNALKFTPRGGSVTVRAFFVPYDDECGSAAMSDSDQVQRLGGEASHWRSLIEDGVAPWPENSSTFFQLKRNFAAFSQLFPNWIPYSGEHRRIRNDSDAITSTRTDRAESPLHSPSFNSDSVVNHRYLDGATVMLSRGADTRDEYKACAADDGDIGLVNAQWDSMDTSERSTNSISNKGRVTYGRLKLIVTDTGAGISEANQLRLFKQIVQFNPEVLQAGGGSGLGLYITSSIVHMHAGAIRAYSAGPGEGSTFTVEIDMQRCLTDCTPPDEAADAQYPYSHPQSAPGVKTSSTGTMGSSIRREGEREGRRERERGEENEGGREREMDFALTSPLMNFEMKEPPPLPLNGKEVHQLSQVSSSDHIALSVDLEGENESEGVLVGSEEVGSYEDVLSDYLAVEPILQQPTDLKPPSVSATLPALRSHTHHQKKELELEQDTHTIPPANNVNTVYDVLVVDDSSLNRKMLCRLLSTAGHTCEVADDGLSAVEKVKTRMSRGGSMTRNYDVILMDFVMPNMDGPSATVIIRGMGYTNPILGLTGNVLDSDVNYFIDSGVNAVLAKPFDFSLFKTLMRTHTYEGASYLT